VVEQNPLHRKITQRFESFRSNMLSVKQMQKEDTISSFTELPAMIASFMKFQCNTHKPEFSPRNTKLSLRDLPIKEEQSPLGPTTQSDVFVPTTEPFVKSEFFKMSPSCRASPPKSYKPERQGPYNLPTPPLTHGKLHPQSQYRPQLQPQSRQPTPPPNTETPTFKTPTPPKSRISRNAVASKAESIKTLLAINLDKKPILLGKRFHCSSCTVTCSTSSHLLRHERIHSKPDRYVVDQLLLLLDSYAVLMDVVLRRIGEIVSDSISRRISLRGMR
jgi:hypothetical protein